MISAKESIRNYLGYNGIDNNQRTLDQALLWSDEVLESTHDFIQWWFPLDELSSFNRHAPVASREEFKELGDDNRVRVGLERAMHRMLRFYGLYQASPGLIEKSNDWDRRSRNWAYRQSHNDLRLTRILKSLCLFGYRADAEALLEALEGIIKKARDPSDQAPLSFWSKAVL